MVSAISEGNVNVMRININNAGIRKEIEHAEILDRRCNVGRS